MSGFLAEAGAILGGNAATNILQMQEAAANRQRGISVAVADLHWL